MKLFLYILLCFVITNEISAQGITKYGQSNTSSTNFVDKNGRVGSDSMLNKNGKELNFPNCGTITDICGNTYNTVTIGTQCWMKENLKTTKYQNGDTIPNVTDSTTWANLITGAYCNYNNDTSIGTTYGRLYNWFAVNDNRKICPTDWHVPTDSEWTILTDYLGGDSVAGGKLKETGYSHWLSPNIGETNESGFTALPGGIRNLYGTFVSIRLYGHWWSSTEYDTNSARHWGMGYGSSNIFSYGVSKVLGFSVRCLRDY